MKRTLATAILLFACCATGFARMGIALPTPQDDPAVRQALRDDLGLKPLADECQSIIEARFWPLKADQIAKVFGPVLAMTTDWWGTEGGPLGHPGLDHYPANLVLPSFSFLGVGLSGGHTAQSKNHTDLHAVGDIGYIEFFYQHDGESIATAAVFFRADDKFVPLKSTDDLPRRLEWDKAKFNALKNWLDQHLPAVPNSQDNPTLTSTFGVQPWQWLFKLLACESQTNNQSRLQSLPAADVAKIFGPRLETAAHPGLLKYPANLVVPGVGSGVMVVDDLHHTDLHAVDDVGYVQFFYRNAAGGKCDQAPAVYFRADEKFVPLKSTNDLPKRLEWDTAKLKAFDKWLDEHLPGK